ncbi:MAG: hypothetical protein AAF548_13850 [Actinomycetota bacterium]
MNLVEQIVELHAALEGAEVEHAFGGALALAWCTERARATIDIDVNLFVDADAADAVLDVFPDGVAISTADRAEIAADGQTRLWWEATPVDVFFNTTPFHRDAARRARVERFGGTDVPFLACRDLAVFKAFFDRTKDWADLEEMQAAGTLDVESILGVLVRYLGGDDHRVERLRSMTS